MTISQVDEHSRKRGRVVRNPMMWTVFVFSGRTWTTGIVVLRGGGFDVWRSAGMRMTSCANGRDMVTMGLMMVTRSGRRRHG